MPLRRHSVQLSIAAAVLILSSSTLAQQRPMSGYDRDRAQEILNVVAKEIKKHYYDPQMHGLDWDAKVAETKKKIAAETSFNMSIAHIAAMIDLLNDSHTFLLPPQHAYRLEQGFEYQMIGDRCYVTHVRPGSDADAKGVKPGDQILALNGFNVSRNVLWKMHYGFTVLRPQFVFRLSLQDPAGGTRDASVSIKVRQEKLVKDLTASTPGGLSVAS